MNDQRFITREANPIATEQGAWLGHTRCRKEDRCVKWDDMYGFVNAELKLTFGSNNIPLTRFLATVRCLRSLKNNLNSNVKERIYPAGNSFGLLLKFHICCCSRSQNEITLLRKLLCPHLLRPFLWHCFSIPFICPFCHHSSHPLSFLLFY